MEFNRQYFGIEEESDIMPIIPLNEDEMSEEEKKNLPEELIILPLRNMVLFPNVVMPITVSREKSIIALKEAERKGKMIGILPQLDPKLDNPETKDFY